MCDTHVINAFVTLLNGSEFAPDEARRLKDIRDQVEALRKDVRPWVKQASLHALYHIEKRKAELEAARRTSKQETAQSE